MAWLIFGPVSLPDVDLSSAAAPGLRLDLFFLAIKFLAAARKRVLSGSFFLSSLSFLEL